MIAFGPELEGWGSWHWVGADMHEELSKYFHTVCWKDAVPACDLLFVVKHAPPWELLERIAPRTAVTYCPVDHYGSAAEIDADWKMLRRCARVVVHCERLRKYFQSYTTVVAMDHHVKFAAPLRRRYRRAGPTLWVGVRTNLPYLIEWVNEHGVPGELVVLTNLEDPEHVPSPAELGFRWDGAVRVEHWSAERQLELTSEARVALDIKGEDFAQRHKPSAKALDFLASGVPLAVNSDSSVAEHLAALGFQVASPLDPDRWLSRAYWEDTMRFGAAVRELFSRERIGLRYRRLVEDVLAERGMRVMESGDGQRDTFDAPKQEAAKRQ